MIESRNEDLAFKEGKSKPVHENAEIEQAWKEFFQFVENLNVRQKDRWELYRLYNQGFGAVVKNISTAFD